MNQLASACSQESEDSTKACDVPGSSMCSCVNPTFGAETCCEHGSPEPQSQTTYDVWQWRTREDGTQFEPVELPNLTRAAIGGTGGAKLWISSSAGSRAKTSASPGTAQDSKVPVPACSTSSPASLALFDPDGFSSRTYPVSSLRRAVGTSESCLERWPTSGTAWPGGFSTHVSSECRSDGDGCSSSEPSLTEILEPPLSVPARYSLSARAAQGILRRAEKRGRTLPGHLAEALASVAGPRTLSE